MAATAASMVARPVRKMTGQSGRSSFSARSSHSPSVSGMARSESTTSGRKSAAFFSASVPSPAVSTLWPQSASISARAWAVLVSSSTARIRALLTVVSSPLFYGSGRPRAGTEREPQLRPSDVELGAVFAGAGDERLVDLGVLALFPPAVLHVQHHTCPLVPHRDPHLPVLRRALQRPEHCNEDQEGERRPVHCLHDRGTLRDVDHQLHPAPAAGMTEYRGRVLHHRGQGLDRR